MKKENKKAYFLTFHYIHDIRNILAGKGVTRSGKGIIKTGQNF